MKVLYDTNIILDLSYIITSNKKDYLSSKITVVEPLEFLKIIENKQNCLKSLWSLIDTRLYLVEYRVGWFTRLDIYYLFIS